MEQLLANPEFWKAMASLAWPIVALVVFLMFRGRVDGLFNRENLSIKVTGMELSVADTTKSLGEQVADIQKRLAQIEQTRASGASVTKYSVATKKIGAKGSGSKSPESDRVVLGSIGRYQQFSILWVDDFPSNNAFIIESFINSGLFVRTALSTAIALEELRSHRFDLVISDLGRIENGVNNPFAGLDLIKTVRSKDKEIPILVYASQRGIEYKSELLAQGASEVTNSPVDVQGFVFAERAKAR